jgi:hypothetical protein
MLTAFELDGQRYERIGGEPAVTKQGRQIALGIFRSHCPDCGAPFYLKRRRLFRVMGSERRCPSCRKRKRVAPKPCRMFEAVAPSAAFPLPQRWRAPAPGDALPVRHSSIAVAAIAETHPPAHSAAGPLRDNNGKSDRCIMTDR